MVIHMCKRFKSNVKLKLLKVPNGKVTGGQLGVVVIADAALRLMISALTGQMLILTLSTLNMR